MVTVNNKCRNHTSIRLSADHFSTMDSSSSLQVQVQFLYLNYLTTKQLHSDTFLILATVQP